ncbi:hypothetical protein BKA93DRAFT_771428 [Sparassis latifolia]
MLSDCYWVRGTEWIDLSEDATGFLLEPFGWHPPSENPVEPVLQTSIDRHRSTSVASSYNSLFDGPYEEDEELVDTRFTPGALSQHDSYNDLYDEALEDIYFDDGHHDDDSYSQGTHPSPIPTVVKMEEYESVLQEDPIGTHDVVADVFLPESTNWIVDGGSIIPSAPRKAKIMAIARITDHFRSERAMVLAKEKRSCKRSPQLTRKRRARRRGKTPVIVAKLGRRKTEMR